MRKRENRDDEEGKSGKLRFFEFMVSDFAAECRKQIKAQEEGK